MPAWPVGGDRGRPWECMAPGPGRVGSPLTYYISPYIYIYIYIYNSPRAISVSIYVTQSVSKCSSMLTGFDSKAQPQHIYFGCNLVPNVGANAQEKDPAYVAHRLNNHTLQTIYPYPISDPYQSPILLSVPYPPTRRQFAHSPFRRWCPTRACLRGPWEGIGVGPGNAWP